MEPDKDEPDGPGPEQTGTETAGAAASTDGADVDEAPADDAAVDGSVVSEVDGAEVAGAEVAGAGVDAVEEDADDAVDVEAGQDRVFAAAVSGGGNIAARVAPRGYRQGRGGYDPEAAELAANARYAFRQRVVLTLLIAALGTGIIAAIGLPVVWYLHGAIDVALVGYLVYLRRQVRLEDEIRFRRAARVAGTRFAHLGDDPVEPPPARAAADDERSKPAPADGPSADEGPPREEEPVDAALPPLPRSDLPGRPTGTTVVGTDDEDPALHPLDDELRPRYRRAAG